MLWVIGVLAVCRSACVSQQRLPFQAGRHVTASHILRVRLHLLLASSGLERHAHRGLPLGHLRWNASSFQAQAHSLTITPSGDASRPIPCPPLCWRTTRYSARGCIHPCRDGLRKPAAVRVPGRPTSYTPISGALVSARWARWAHTIGAETRTRTSTHRPERDALAKLTIRIDHGGGRDTFQPAVPPHLEAYARLSARRTHQVAQPVR